MEAPIKSGEDSIGATYPFRHSHGGRESRNRGFAGTADFSVLRNERTRSGHGGESGRSSLLPTVGERPVFCHIQNVGAQFFVGASYVAYNPVPKETGERVGDEGFSFLEVLYLG